MALAMVLAVLLGGNMGSIAAEVGGGDIKGANTSGDQPARSRPPYVGVWGIWKEVTVDISDGNFQNHCPHNTDIMLTNMDDEDDVFHMIELTQTQTP